MVTAVSRRNRVRKVGNWSGRLVGECTFVQDANQRSQDAYFEQGLYSRQNLTEETNGFATYGCAVKTQSARVAVSAPPAVVCNSATFVQHPGRDTVGFSHSVRYRLCGHKNTPRLLLEHESSVLRQKCYRTTLGTRSGPYASVSTASYLWVHVSVPSHLPPSRLPLKHLQTADKLSHSPAVAAVCADHETGHILLCQGAPIVPRPPPYMPNHKRVVQILIPVVFGGLALLILVLGAARPMIQRYRERRWRRQAQAIMMQPSPRSKLQYSDLEASRDVPSSPEQSNLSPNSVDASAAQGSAPSVLRTPPWCHVPVDSVSRGHRSLQAGALPADDVLHTPAQSYASPPPPPVLQPPPSSTSPARTDPFANDAAELPALIDRINSIMAHLPPGGVVEEEPPEYKA